MSPPKRTACVLLKEVGVAVFPGPPKGPVFDGLVRFCFVRRIRDGRGPHFAHRTSGKTVGIDFLFQAADMTFGGSVDALDVFVAEEERGDWYLDGPGVPTDFAEA